MNTQVDALTISAGPFFADRKLVVPDYQRRYSWDADQQISDFWRDLSGGLGAGDYFLGLVILSEGVERQEIVDGQQRLVTLTIFANELRLIATSLGRRLVADSIRNDFLYWMDYETEEQVPRVLLTDRADRDDLQALLNATDESSIKPREGSAIHEAHLALMESLKNDIMRHDNPALRVGQWTEFITKRLTFAVFMHPDRSAAFRVYEVINTRGKDLTPTELIKSFLIGSSDASMRDETNQRWNAIEEQLKGVGAFDQLTTFVRQVVTLDQGYVIPRELYQIVSSKYSGTSGVSRLLQRLEVNFPVYMQMLDPSADVESSEVRTRAFVLADALALARFRPVLLAALQSPQPDVRLQQLLEILVPGAITGKFGTGSIDAQFARAARRLQAKGEWDVELRNMRTLMPTSDEFRLRMLRGVNKRQAHVLRAAFVQSERLPQLDGFPHQVRPRNGEDWAGFDDDAFRDVGGLLANWTLTETERRPQGTRTPEAVIARLLPNLLPRETLTADDVRSWSARAVKEETEVMANALTGLWYGSE
jgi:hypothetical protein